MVIPKTMTVAAVMWTFFLMVACGDADSRAPRNGGAPESQTDPGLTIAVIPKGTTHVFWKSVEAGARQAGESLGVQIVWKGPLKENDRAGQIQVMQQFIAQNVDGIVLAPLDSKALIGPARAAMDKNIPVVIFDSSLDGEIERDFVSYVATDNGQGGKLAGAELARLLNDTGKVVMLRYQVGSASTAQREAGFLEVIQGKARIEVISENRYVGATSGEAQTAALNLMGMIRQTDGIFTPNESSTNGMLQALRKQGLAGKIRFVGFDASPPLVEALRNGEIDALVVQDPRKMGHDGVQTLVRYIRGERVAQAIDTGVVLVTPNNLNEPKIAELIE